MKRKKIENCQILIVLFLNLYIVLGAISRVLVAYDIAQSGFTAVLLQLTTVLGKISESERFLVWSLKMERIVLKVSLIMK